MNKIELLAPAGDLSRLKIAFLYGADAVYLGGRNYSLRANATNFSLEDIAEACSYAHNLGKKVYVTVNIVFHNEDLGNLVEYLQTLADIQVDAIIISDIFILDLIKEHHIDLEVHLSTQASVLNIEAVKFYQQLGISRIVLAREASREDIYEIIQKTNMDIETFVHGAMCSSVSGRCVLSNYFTNRDANRGGCSQICRFEFDLCNRDKKIIPSDTKFTMSTKDLSMIDYLDDMINIGIKSLKVEGRMRSIYYIATVINTYRLALDDIYHQEFTKDKQKYYKKILNRVANRDSTSHFYLKTPGVNEQYFLGRQEASNQDFLALVLDYNEELHEVTVMQKNYFKKGDKVEIFGPSIIPFTFIMDNIYDEEGNLLEVANHPEQIIKFKLDKKVYQNDIIRIKI